MRKSEMIDLLTDKLLLASPIAITEEEAEKLANEVLNLVEENGMLPPQNGNEYDSYFVGSEYFCSSTPSYSWEKE